MNSGYRWYRTCAPGPDHHEGSLRKAFWQPRRIVSDATESCWSQPKAMAAGLSAVPTKVSPECSLVPSWTTNDTCDLVNYR